MRGTRAVCLLLLLRATGARGASPAGTGNLAVRCGKIIDGRSDAAGPAATVLIQDGRIQALGPDVAVPEGLRLLDISAYSCLPGLIDMHTHLLDSPEDSADLKLQVKRSRKQALRRGRRHARATLMAGFTTVRDVGAYQGWADRDLRDEIARGETPGPRMQAAGFYLTVPGGGGDLLIPGVPEGDIPPGLRLGVARGAEAFGRKAREAAAGGADIVKVIASGAVLAYGGVPGEPEMSPEEIFAAAEAAHAAGLKLAAHAHGARSIREAILAGADTVEHASFIDGEGIRLARERGVALVMDVYNGDYIDSEGRRAGMPAEFLEKNLATLGRQREGFTAALRAGAPLVFGTDAAVYPHGQNARQFRVMVRLGMKPMEAVKSASSAAARAMGWEDRVGSLSPGRFGDLIAVAGDPLADIGRLESVAAVVKGGIVFKSPETRPPGKRLRY